MKAWSDEKAQIVKWLNRHYRYLRIDDKFKFRLDPHKPHWGLTADMVELENLIVKVGGYRIQPRHFFAENNPLIQDYLPVYLMPESD